MTTTELWAMLADKSASKIHYALGDGAICVEAIEFEDGSSIRLDGIVDGQVEITSFTKSDGTVVDEISPTYVCKCGWQGAHENLKASDRPSMSGGRKYNHCPQCPTPVWQMDACLTEDQVQATIAKNEQAAADQSNETVDEEEIDESDLLPERNWQTTGGYYSRK